MKRLLCALLTLPTGPSTLHAAEPRPVQLSMKATAGETRHLADGAGAINRHGSLTITVELLPGKSLKAVALGTHKEHNLYAKQGYGYFVYLAMHEYSYKAAEITKESTLPPM